MPDIDITMLSIPRAPQSQEPAYEARPTSVTGQVDQADLDTDQCQRLRDAAGRRLGWVRRLLQRMDERGWAKSDPLYEQVKRAADEVMRLDMLLMQIGLVAHNPRARRIAPAYKPEERSPKAQ